MGHSLTFNVDEHGWDIASCECGWVSPACPGEDIAAECYADHRVETALAGREQNPDG